MHAPSRTLIGVLALLSGLVALTASAARSTFRADPHYIIDAWETDDGLPENSATAIVQTPDGYLWFGTFNGLVRFNGVQFTVFNPDNTPQLPDVGIVNLHLDKGGRLWVSTYRGLVVYADGQWRQLTRIDVESGDYARTFAERANGDLLITTFSGKLFEFSNGQVAELPPPPGEKGQGYFGGVDEDGHWWAVQHKFIGHWEKERWVPMISPPDNLGTAVGFAPARDGGMWLLLGNELRRLRRGTEVARVTLSEPPGGVWSLSEDSQGNVWIATFDQGVCRVSTNGTMVWWSAANGESDHGRCVFEDREKNLWVGTSGDGLRRFTSRRIHHFAPEGGRKALQVQSVWPDVNGGVWAGTYGRGLFHFSEAGVTNVALPGLPSGPAYVKSVLVDRAGRLWVGTMTDALWLVENGSARHIPRAQTGGHNVSALFEDSRGRIWVCGGSGVAVFDGDRSRGFGPEQGLPVGAVTSFAEDSSSAIWVSNGSGVFRSESGQNFAEVMDITKRPIRGIGCLKGDPDGSMWLGSSSRGLLRWKDGRLASLDPQTGFPVSEIRGLVEDADGFFWMTSGRSIVRARRSDLHAAADGFTARLAYQVFDASDGLPRAEFTSGRQPTCARDAKGRLWFATTKGVAMIEPAAFHLNDAPPPVYVEGISFYKPAPPATSQGVDPGRVKEIPSRLSGPFAGPVLLPAGSRRIEIHYAGLSLTAPEKVRFQFKLDGQDVSWQEVGSRRVAYYHDLPPRDYVFRVRAANNDGIWNDAGTSLAFTMQPHFWQTLWFKTLVLVVLAAAAYGGFHRRVIRLEKERTVQHGFARQLIISQENERKRVAAELHDGLGQNLLLIKNRLALALTRQSDAAEHLRQLEAATAATTRAISEVRAISQALRPAALEQAGLTKAIEWMVEQLGAGSPVKFSTELDNIDGLLAPELEINLYRIVQEGLNNITRHAGARQVILELKREQAGVSVSILDDGLGFDVEKMRNDPDARRGLGLAGMKERAEYLGGSFDLQSAPGRGTRVTVRVPLPREATRPGAGG